MARSAAPSASSPEPVAAARQRASSSSGRAGARMGSGQLPTVPSLAAAARAARLAQGHPDGADRGEHGHPVGPLGPQGVGQRQQRCRRIALSGVELGPDHHLVMMGGPEPGPAQHRGARQDDPQGRQADGRGRIGQHGDEGSHHPRQLELGFEASEGPPFLGVGSQSLGDAVEGVPSGIRPHADGEGGQHGARALVLDGADQREDARGRQRRHQQRLVPDALARLLGHHRAGQAADPAGHDGEPEDPGWLARLLEVEGEEEGEEAHGAPQHAHGVGRQVQGVTP